MQLIKIMSRFWLKRYAIVAFAVVLVTVVTVIIFRPAESSVLTITCSGCSFRTLLDNKVLWQKGELICKSNQSS